MNKITCPHCGEAFENDRSFDIPDHESTHLEIILAQLSREYRLILSEGYPIGGESDIDAVLKLLKDHEDETGRISVQAFADIVKQWRKYLGEKGNKGQIAEFVSMWLPAKGRGAEIIPFRRR